ncbi:four-carbon acid sugar kinase family protein, partial [Chryseobacterium sp. SIMBA_038]
KDVVFGFSNAHLPSWVIEKGGADAVEQIRTITLADIRLGGVVRVHSILLAAQGNTPIIVNAASYEDLDILSVALLRALEMGKRFL